MPLKCLIRSQYHDYVHQLLKKPASESPSKARNPVAISRETLIGFIDFACNTMNVDNRKKSWFVEPFNQCGQRVQGILIKLSENR